ncbi:MAG: hypothetical protein ACPLW8_06525 [Candidatus Bathyarchaeales archaeon]
MQRNTLFVLTALLGISIAYAFALYGDMQRYEMWEQSYLQEHPEVAPYIDFKPYFASNPFAYISLLYITICWLIFIAYTWVARCKEFSKAEYHNHL